MLLEVIVENEPAIALYEKLGFRKTRLLEVLTLDRAEGGTAEEVELEEAGRLIPAEPEPWQRDDDTVANLAGVAALATGTAAVVYRTEGERVHLLQAGGEGVGDLITALRARGPILALNYPADGPVATALHDAGATLVLRQHEMVVGL